MEKVKACLLILVFLWTTGFAMATGHGQGVQYDLIVTDPWGEQTKTGGKAIVSPGEVWVSVEIVKWYTNEVVSVNQTDKRLDVTITTPRFRLETPHLDELVKSGLSLQFPLRLIHDRPYVNLKTAGPILGLTVVTHDHNKTVEMLLTTSEEKYHPQINKPRQTAPLTKPFNLVWDHVFGESRNIAAEPTLPGLHVISPTWFAVVDEQGTVTNKGNRSYVADAHQKNMQVWALVSNSFNRDMTKKILASAEAQTNIIKQLVTYVSLYDLDGINVDFENVYDDDKDRLTAFVANLGKALKEQNVILSVDVTVPSKVPFWSPCYDRKELSKIADYIMVMTYDEHWRLSPVAGSTASLPWVEKGVKAMLAEVPPEKLMLGMPFYTRLWTETTSETGGTNVKSQALSMAQAESIIAENESPVVWLADKGQHYTEYYKNGNRHRIWLEDKASIALKAQLVPKYGLAGTASWRRGFEKEEIWSVIQEAVKKSPAP